MSRALSFSVMFFFIYIGVFLLVQLGYVNSSNREAQQAKLQYAANKASDAAIMQLLKYGDSSLGMDTHDLAGITVNPQIALDTFVDVMLFNYDLPVTESNRQLIRTRFMPNFTVVTNDGYYIATLQQIDENERGSGFDLRFSPKLPFTYIKGDDFYNLSLSQEYIWKYHNGSFKRIVASSELNVLFGLDSKYRVQREINKIVLSHIANSINLTNAENYDWVNEFFIPSDLNEVVQINPIQGVSVLALLQNVNLNSNTPLSTLSVAGSKITKARLVVAYERDGSKYYCYHDIAPNESIRGEILEMFNNTVDAAKAGYYCDIKYMYNSIDNKVVGEL